MSAAIENELERLALEVESWKLAAQAANQLLDAAREERDALAGTVRAYEQSFKNLSADCDALASELRSHKAALDGLQDERDALAMHLQEGRELATELLITDETNDATSLTEWAESGPATQTLDWFKAKWQADAISQYARDHLGGLEQEAAEIYAAKLRRQAEGDS